MTSNNEDFVIDRIEDENEYRQEETDRIENVEMKIETEIEVQQQVSLDEIVMEEDEKCEKEEEEEQQQEQQLNCEEQETDEKEIDNSQPEVAKAENSTENIETEFKTEIITIINEDEVTFSNGNIELEEKKEILEEEYGSKSDDSQLPESFGENIDADSEAGGETDETEVEIDERTQPEGRSSRETSPTPCPPESPSDSVPPLSVASTPDLKRDGGDVMTTSSSVDVKNELMLKLDSEINKDTVFQQRFFILASNYDEMIKMKDDYKAENERLRMENMQMKMENQRIYNEKLESKERENHKLHQTVDYLKRELAETQSKLRTANDDYKNLCLSYEQKILRLVQNLSVAEETLADTVYKLREQELVRSRQERENRRQCERLQKEKNDLMDLALSGDRNNFYLS